MTSLAGRVALVTGAGSGIGRDLCRALASAGARVAVAVRRRDTGEETARLIEAESGRSLVLEMDVTDAISVEAGIGATTERFGGLDILIHNANNGLASGTPLALEAADETDWARQGDVTLFGAFHCARAAHRHLAGSGHGRLIVMTSTFGYHGAAMNPIYSAQKAAYRGFIKSLAREWGPDGITVNAIAPAAATPPTRMFFARHPALEAQYLSNFALGRMGDPLTDIGEAVVALSGDALGFMTGQTLHLDGGLYPAA